MPPEPNRRVLASWIVLALPPLALLILLLVFNGSNVVFGDDVSMCPIFDKFYASTLTFNDLWEPYQGHRILFLRLVELGLGWATHWNTAYDIGFVYAAALCDFLLLCLLLQGLRGVVSGRARFVLALIFSLALFSTSQEENWTNGFMLGAALSASCVLAGVVCLSRLGTTYRVLLLCILLGIIASYSFGNGVTYWAAVVPLLYVKLRGDPWWPVKSLIWAVSAGTVIVLYFHRLGGNGSSESFGGLALGILRVPGAFFTYFFSCAGAGVFFLNGTKAALPGAARTLIACGAPICGVVGLTAFAFAVWRLLRRREQDARIAPWLSLSLYALFTVAAICLTRYRSAPESAIASRYILFSQFLWLALFVCLVILWPGPKPGWMRGMGVVLILCYLISYANGLRHEQMICADLRQIRQELLIHPTDETYRAINGDRDPAQVAAFMETTRQHHLALFHDEPSH